MNQSTIEYVRKLRGQGYSDEVIRSQLIGAGHDPASVDSVLRVSAGGSKKLLFVFFGVLVVLAIAIVFLLYILVPPASLLSLDIYSPGKYSVGSSALISGHIDLVQGRAVQVKLVYQIVGVDGSLVARKEESLLVDRSVDVGAQLLIPNSTVPGQYTATISMSYDDKSVSRSASIDLRSLLDKDVEVVDCPYPCDDFNKCTVDKCVNGRCVYEVVLPCCGNDLCETGENVLNCAEDCKAAITPSSKPGDIINQARDSAKVNVDRAASLCATISVSSSADDCYYVVAEQSGNSAVCGVISGVSKRDDCYVMFMLKDDYSVCGKISNKYLRANCESYARLKSMKFVNQTAQ